MRRRRTLGIREREIRREIIAQTLVRGVETGVELARRALGNRSAPAMLMRCSCDAHAAHRAAPIRQQECAQTQRRLDRTVTSLVAADMEAATDRQDDRGAIEHRRRRVFNHEIRAFHVNVALLVKRRFVHFCDRRKRRDAPALTNNTSMRPCLYLTVSTKALVAAMSPASEAMTSVPDSSSRAASSVLGLEPVTITVAPSSRNSWAVAAPMPVVPPVMSAILFYNLFLFVFFLGVCCC